MFIYAILKPSVALIMKQPFFNSPARTKYAFVAAVAILLVLSIFSFERIQQQKSSSDWVERAYFVKFKLKEAFSNLRDAEASQGAYLLTQDSALLDRFVRSIADIPTIVGELDSVIHQSQQQQDLQLFASLLQQRITRLNGFLDSAETLNGEQLYNFLVESRINADRTRTLINIMEMREDHLLHKRLSDKRQQEALASAFILLFSITSLTILTISFFRLRKEIFRRSESEDNANKLEEEVARRTAVIRKINEELHRKNEELERKNEELSSFTYIASHDLKEPVRKISVFTDRITHSDGERLSEEGKKFLERTRAAIRHMQRLIDAVFSYSRTEHEHAFEMLSLNEVATQAQDLLQETIDEKAALVQVDSLPQVYAVKDQMEQLFTNLISNSLKYARPGITPTIQISASPKEVKVKGRRKKVQGWLLEFRDNGIGFDAQYKDKIFQIFQRLHNREDYGGTGVGLAICKKIAENHGGTIQAHGVPGEGAVFTVFLPQEAPAGEAHPEQDNTPEAAVP